MFNETNKQLRIEGIHYFPTPESLLRRTRHTGVVVADWDGVAADTETCVWDDVRKTVVASNTGDRIILTPEEQVACQGQNLPSYLMKYFIVPSLRLHGQQPPSVEEIARQIKEVKARLMAERTVLPVPGSIEFFQTLHELGFVMAVASSSDTNTVRKQAEEYGIADCFQYIFGTEFNTGSGKVDLFRFAGEQLGERNPSFITVIEDAVSGVDSAIRLGAHCIAVPRPYQDPATGEVRTGFGKADFVIPSLTSIDLSRVR